MNFIENLSWVGLDLLKMLALLLWIFGFIIHFWVQVFVLCLNAVSSFVHVDFCAFLWFHNSRSLSLSLWNAMFNYFVLVI